MLDQAKDYIVSLPTPFSNGHVDTILFAAFVEWHIREGSKIVLVAHETGEAPTLTMTERDTLVRIAVEVSAGRVPVIAGVVTNGTERAVVLARSAARMGADAVLVAVPYYNKPTQKGIIEHFRTVAEAGVPVLVHNMPGSTAVDLLPATIARIALCSGMLGVVDATSDPMRLATITQLTASDFWVLAGDDARGPSHMLLGGQGWLSVGASVLPRHFRKLQLASCAGNAAHMRAVEMRLSPLIGALSRESSPGTVKHALAISAGWNADLRLPLVSVSAATAAEIEAALSDLRPY